MIVKVKYSTINKLWMNQPKDIVDEIKFWVYDLPNLADEIIIKRGTNITVLNKMIGYFLLVGEYKESENKFVCYETNEYTIKKKGLRRILVSENNKEGISIQKKKSKKVWNGVKYFLKIRQLKSNPNE